MFSHILSVLDRFAPNADTMPLDELIALYVVGISAWLALGCWAARGLLRSSRENRARAVRHEMRIASINRYRRRGDA